MGPPGTKLPPVPAAAHPNPDPGKPAGAPVGAQVMRRLPDLAVPLSNGFAAHALIVRRHQPGLQVAGLPGSGFGGTTPTAVTYMCPSISTAPTSMNTPVSPSIMHTGTLLCGRGCL